MEINIVNCFCLKEKDSGNPAAIVRDFLGDRDEKQKLAKKLGMPVMVFLYDGNQLELHRVEANIMN